MARKHKIEHVKEKISQKVMLTILGSCATALVAGLLGYKLNMHVPELYYDIAPRPVSTLQGYQVKTAVSNLGNAAATDLVIRYSFNKPIIGFDYVYSEGFNGKLPSANISGGISEKELLLTPQRLLQSDTLEATFTFAYPVVSGNIRIFSRETSGRPLSERTERLTKRAEFWHKLTLSVQNFFYKVKKPSEAVQTELP